MTCFYCHNFDCDHTDNTCEKRIADKKIRDDDWNKWAAERQAMYESLPIEPQKHYRPHIRHDSQDKEFWDERGKVMAELDKTPQIERQSEISPLTSMGYDQTIEKCSKRLVEL